MRYASIAVRLVGHNYVASLRTLGAALDREFDLLAFFEVLETITLDGGEMDENVRAAFARDEAEALGPIEPLNDTADTF